MAPFFRDNCVAFSTCIIAKAKHALGVPTTYKGNSKTCSFHYWKEACEKVGESAGCSGAKINSGIKKYKQYAT